jgi:hypothetical protein
LMILLALVIGIGALYLLPPLRRQMRLHEAYVRGESTPLIQPQPTLTDQSVQQLWIRLKRKPGATSLYMSLVLIVAALVGLMVIRFHDEPAHTIIQLMVLSCVMLEPLGITIPPGSLFHASPLIRADSEGLNISKRKTIKWRDARIFARVGSYRRDPRLAYYELVDDKQSLTFAVALKPPSRFALVKPAASFEEYERQTQQLLGMIAAKTGLPLVDLRSRKHDEV